jgi:Mg-chelatase subunit ChlD
MSEVDLDNLESAPQEPSEGPTDMVHSPSTQIAQGSTLEEIYDARTKLIFVLDTSGSMQTCDVKGMSRIDIVKRAAKRFVENRFAKWPKALVSLYEFEGRARLVAGELDKERTLAAVAGLYANGSSTDITNAVKAAMKECAKPTKAGFHHAVLVTDGEDYGAKDIRALIPAVKASRMVFDVIKIQGDYNYLDENVTRTMKDLCEMTGGEYTVIEDITEFETKFLAVSARLCLPKGD